MSNSIEDQLLDLLCEIPALDNREGRDMLLRNLPPKAGASIERTGAKQSDLYQILLHAGRWGQIEGQDRSALAIVIENAKRLVSGTDLGRRLAEIQLQLEQSETPVEFASPPAKPAGTTEQKRIQQRLATLNKQWDMLNELLERLEQSRILETRVEEKLRLDAKIAETKADRDRLEREIAELESRL